MVLAIGVVDSQLNTDSCEKLEECASVCQNTEKVEEFNKGNEMSKDYEFKKVELIKVIDGDTVRFEVDLGFRMKCIQTFRLRGIDTPEIYRPINENELRHGRQAKQFLENVFKDAQEIIIKSHKTGIWGRWEADITVVENGKISDLKELLIEAGFKKKESY